MITVELVGIGIGDVLDLVQSLRQEGYLQELDFDFAYYPEEFDGFTHGRRKRTEFRFYNEQLGLLFKLKYS